MDLIKIATRIASNSFTSAVTLQIELRPITEEDGTEEIFEVYVDGELHGNVFWTGLEFQNKFDEVLLPDSVLKKLSADYLNSMV